jgi:Ala-tRNA(Pro) deacylase
MAISITLKQFLDEHHAHYVPIEHPRALTAQETAERAHVTGRALAKVVVVHPGTDTVMLVLPAARRIDLARLAARFPGRELRLASEEELRAYFPDCEIGAMSPFGNLYGMWVMCDTSLSERAEIVFNAGTHEDALRMSFREYADLVRPELAAFSLPAQ